MKHFQLSERPTLHAVHVREFTANPAYSQSASKFDVYVFIVWAVVMCACLGLGFACLADKAAALLQGAMGQ
jgi:hypothetical protein